MQHNSTPSWEDYRRLRRALLGFLLLLLALILGGVASMLPSSYNPIANGLFGLFPDCLHGRVALHASHAAERPHTGAFCQRIVALYLAAAVWLSEPEERIAWRLLTPFAILGLLSTAVWFVVTFVIIPIRWTWMTVAKLLRRHPEATDADSI